MFDNVVVGIDNYEAGRDALELAKQLVPPTATCCWSSSKR